MTDADPEPGPRQAPAAPWFYPVPPKDDGPEDQPLSAAARWAIRQRVRLRLWWARVRFRFWWLHSLRSRWIETRMKLRLTWLRWKQRRRARR